ncbi:hypothetical protein RJT34_21518 [Clitoria ternatea]|uniref:Uncharacterized protein n=1 Tax=Clitoria ternatea TaxID=43366 RepID=A0AAN9IUG6_CLITE
MSYLPSVLATATLIHVVNSVEPGLGAEYESQLFENLHRHYGKEPRSMEIILKKLYLRRMAADLGITRIYSSGKMIFMKTNMSKKVFTMMTESMASDLYRNALVLEGDQIKAELLLELPKEQLLNWIFQCLAELHASLPTFIMY